MNRLRVVPIVEGHGEYECVRILLERVWCELLGGEHVEVLRPIRAKRGQLVQKVGLQRMVGVALEVLGKPPASGDPALVLILLDADRDCPAVLGPRLLGYAREVDSRIEMSCVVAKVEYETWFAAAAESLGSHLDLPPGFQGPVAPEESGMGKGWVERHFQGIRYSETQDQPAMTRAMNLRLCRDRSPSFDKLCRELERLI